MTATEQASSPLTVRYTGDGDQTEFFIPWPLFSPDNVQIYLDGRWLSEGYEIQWQEGRQSQVVFTTAPLSGQEVTLLRHVSAGRMTDFQENALIRAGTLNLEFDHQVAALQGMGVGLERAVRLSPLDDGAALVLPAAKGRAGAVLGFDDGGDLTTYARDGLGLLPTGQSPACYWRSNDHGTALEARTAPQVRADIGADRAGNVRYAPAFSGGTDRSLVDRLMETVSLADFGAVPGQDCTNALRAALAAGTAMEAELVVPAGTYRLSGDQTFLVDLGRCGLRGLGGAVFDCSAMTAAHAFQFFSSRPYYQDHLSNPHAVRDLVIQGAGNVDVTASRGRHGILLGRSGDDYRFSCEMLLDGVSVAGFDRNIVFGDNAWRSLLIRCTSLRARQAHVYVPAGLLNFGEEQGFYHCKFGDGWNPDSNSYPEFYIGTPSFFNLHGCSLLHSTLHIDAVNAQVHMFGGNMENAGTNESNVGIGYSYARLTAGLAGLALFGTNITVNGGSTSAAADTAPLFQTTDATQSILFQGVNFPDVLIDRYLPLSSNQVPVFVAGPARVAATACTMWIGAGGARIPLSAAANAVANGDFEQGALGAWNALAYGAGGTATVSAGAAHTGRYGLRIVSAPGGGMNVTQSLSVRPGDLVVVFTECRVVTASAYSGNIALLFYDSAGNVLSSIGPQATEATWQRLSFGVYAPSGAARVVVGLNAQNGATMDFDNVIVNIL